MNNDSKIALLWLIRENRPISINEIIELLDTDSQLLPPSIRNELMRNLDYHPSHALEDLSRLGLIETNSR